MHVLFLPSWYPAHPEDIRGSFFREQALAMQRSGCKVGVIAPALRSLRKPTEALRSSGGLRHQDDHGLPTYRASRPNLTPRIWSLTARRIVHVTRLLCDAYIAQHGKPDLIHVHAALPAGAGALDIKQRRGVPFILSEHSSAFARGKVNFQGRNLARQVALEASQRFAVSTPFARFLEDTLALPNQTFSVMPNMVDHIFLSEGITRKAAGDFNFLHVSTLDENKNLPVLLHAFADRFRKRTDVSLTVAGEGPTRPALETLAITLGISGQVSFSGRLSRSEVRAALSKSDAFVLPSRFETFGVVLVEALAMGVPVIATRCGGPEDIVSNANGLLVPVDDIGALADAMMKVQQNPSAYDRHELRHDCRTHFGPEVISQKWLNIYENALTNTDAKH